MQNNLKQQEKRIKANFNMVIFSSLLLVFIFSISFSSATLQLGLDGTTDGVGINFIAETPINVSGPAANQSDVWITNIGNLDNANSTQFSNNGGTFMGLSEKLFLKISD